MFRFSRVHVMLSKASHTMNRNLKKNIPLVSQVSGDQWLVRAPLSFPQGLQVIYKLFEGTHIAEAYSHPFFLEAEYWPEQPSPQMHLTEEIQCLMFVLKGITQMDDPNTHLDNSMSLLRNPKNTSEFAIYNPARVNEESLKHVNKVLEENAGTITTLIVPTRQTWQDVDFWRVRFPNAKILCSGCVPDHLTKEGVAAIMNEGQKIDNSTIAEGITKISTRRVHSSGSTPSGGLQADDMPRSTRSTRVQHGRGSLADEPSERLTPEAPPGMVLRGLTHPALSEKKTGALSVLGSTGGTGEIGEGMAQYLHRKIALALNEASLYETEESKEKRIAQEKLARENQEEFLKAAGEDDADKVAPETATPIDGVELLPRTKEPIDLFDGAFKLFRVRGDPATNEFVLYHPQTGTLQCTDLYHGGYTDYDPMNSWLCRVWFKFQRDGNYKSKTLLPSYRKLAIQQRGSMAKMQHWIDSFTRNMEIKTLLFSHGTNPISSACADLLRLQYELKPLVHEIDDSLPARGTPEFLRRQAEERKLEEARAKAAGEEPIWNTSPLPKGYTTKPPSSAQAASKREEKSIRDEKIPKIYAPPEKDFNPFQLTNEERQRALDVADDADAIRRFNQKQEVLRARNSFGEQPQGPPGGNGMGMTGGL